MASFNDISSKSGVPNKGAFVVSLDFELHWGVRDHMLASGPYRKNLLGARVAIPGILDLFQRYGISATWATVGFLFATSRSELQTFRPQFLPEYTNVQLDPYREPIGANENEDPLHYAGSLIQCIRKCPGQEIGTHTFSHFCCLEPGQNLQAFEADLDSAIAIARSRGLELRTIVFPRNQIHREYVRILLGKGIRSYRGCARGWMYRPSTQRQNTFGARIARLADSYFQVSTSQVVPWSEVLEPSGLCNVRASMFLRPVQRGRMGFERARIRRIQREMETAASRQGIFHLWFHPHNFGIHSDENLAFLEEILRAFTVMRARYGMSSLSMTSVAEQVTSRQEHLFDSRLPASTTHSLA